MLGRWPGVGTQHETLRQKQSGEGKSTPRRRRLADTTPAELLPNSSPSPSPGGMGHTRAPEPRAAPLPPRAPSRRSPGTSPAVAF